jgi:hypothetical protein
LKGSLLVALAVGVFMGSACRTKYTSCNPGTLFVTVTFEGNIGEADTLHTSVSDGGLVTSGSLRWPAPVPSPATVEIDFPHGYPADQEVSVTLMATKNGKLVGSGSVNAIFPAPCINLTIHLISPNLVPDAGGAEGGIGGADGGDGGSCHVGTFACSDGNSLFCNMFADGPAWMSTACAPSICRNHGCATMCPIPSPHAGDTLPFAVDSVYSASGYSGDPTTIKNSSANSCADAGGRSSPTAKGACWSAAYTPSGIAGAPDNAGVTWLYPSGNLNSMSSGYAMPAGATKVSFWARGAQGNEVVTFQAGDPRQNPVVDCADSFFTSTMVTLTTTWTSYSMPLPADAAAGGVIRAFGWHMQQSDVKGGIAMFWIDDIVWSP